MSFNSFRACVHYNIYRYDTNDDIYNVPITDNSTCQKEYFNKKSGLHNTRLYRKTILYICSPKIILYICSIIL